MHELLTSDRITHAKRFELIVLMAQTRGLLTKKMTSQEILLASARNFYQQSFQTTSRRLLSLRENKRFSEIGRAV
jgi:hypothetical protein